MTSQNSGYLGNDRLKKPNEKIIWTKKRLTELKKCATDQIYFIKTYVKVVHPDKGFVPFNLYPYQEEIVKKSATNRRTIVLTARQSGKTTTAVAIMLHYILFNDFKTIAILANKADTARGVLARLKLAYEALPKWLQQGVIEWHKGAITLENKSRVIAGATSSSNIRGETINFLYIDECAFVEGFDEFFASVYPTISAGNTTKMLMTSTPNGLNHFWKIWKGAEECSNGYAHVKVMWYDVPGKDEAWKQETLEAFDFDTQKFAQEFECEFLGSSGTLISGDKLKLLAGHCATPIYDKNSIMQYNKPEANRSYVIIADVSRGKGLDYSAFSVIDVTEVPYKQVMTFRDNFIGPVDYGEIIYQTAKAYNNAYVLIEINDIGAQVAEMLYYDLGHEEMLFTENAGRAGKRISSGYGKNVDRGIRTTKSVKSIGCSILKLMVEQDKLIVQDFNTINELSKFSKKGNSYEAESGSHDDLVMGLVLFSWLTDQTFFRDLTDIDTMKVLREKTQEEIEKQVAPIFLHYDGVNDEDAMLPF